MAKKIIPAILTSNREDFLGMLKSCSSFCNHIQIDIMDGKFVPSYSIIPKDLDGILLDNYVEAHLMVEDPIEWIEPFKKIGAQEIIFHVEIDKSIDKIIEFVKKSGLKAGLAINPDTSLSKLDPYLRFIDSVLFMSVVPGFYGSKFIPQTLEKIKEFKKKSQLRTGIDGGVKLSNLTEVISSGVDNICVGSAILKAESPALAYNEFVLKLNGI